MSKKELLIDFINYCKDVHVMPILYSDIEPLADDYLAEIKVKNEFASCEHCGWAIEDCNCLPN